MTRWPQVSPSTFEWLPLLLLLCSPAAAASSTPRGGRLVPLAEEHQGVLVSYSLCLSEWSQQVVGLSFLIHKIGAAPPTCGRKSGRGSHVMCLYQLVFIWSTQLPGPEEIKAWHYFCSPGDPEHLEKSTSHPKLRWKVLSAWELEWMKCYRKESSVLWRKFWKAYQRH